MSRKLWAGLFPPVVYTAHFVRQVRRAKQYLRRQTLTASGPHRFGEGDNTVELLVLGDSTGVGIGAALEESLVWRVASALATNRSVVLTNLASSGARSSQVVNHQIPVVVESGITPDLVLVCVGSNDVTHMVQGRGTVAAFERSFRTLIADCRKACPNAAIVLTGAADMRASPLIMQGLRQAVDWRVRRVNQIVEASAKSAGVTYAPLAKIAGPEFRTNRKCFAEDGFHPSAYGYLVLANALQPFVERALASRLNQ